MALSRPRSFAASKQRVGIALLPTADPRVWETPESFHHVEGQATIALFHNGRRLCRSAENSPVTGDFFVLESGAGIGYGIKMTGWNPDWYSTLRADYVAR